MKQSLLKAISLVLLVLFLFCSALPAAAQFQKTEAIGVVNSQTGTSYTIVFADRGKLITFNNGSAVAVTLPQATSSGDFRSGWTTFVRNLGAGTVTITPTTSTINGASSLALATGEGAIIFSNGTNYFAVNMVVTSSAAPSGLAGGALDGNYPSPGIAASVAGNGLAEASDVLSVNVDNSTIEINSDTLRVKDAGVTDAKLATPYIKADGTRAFTGDQSLGSHKLTSVTDPSSAQDAATKNYVDAGTKTLTNTTIDAEGTGNVITLTQKINLIAAGCDNATAGNIWDLNTSGAMGKACLGSGVRFGVLTGADGSTSAAFNHFKWPVDWTGNVDILVEYTGDTSSANNIRTQVSVACVADGEDLLSPSFNTASAANNAGPSTAGQKKSVSFSNVNTANCSANEHAFFKLERIGADAGDTYTGVAQYLNVEITPRRAQ